MNKKYFALTAIALSVAVAGCSDDDDDETDPVDPPAATVEGSGLDTVPAGTLATTLAGFPDIVAALDAPDATYTIFAPSDAAFTAYETQVTDSLANDDAADDLTPLADLADGSLDRILRNHVVSGQIDTTNFDGVYNTLAVADAADAASVAQTLTLSADGTAIATIGGADVALGAVASGTETDADGVAIAAENQDQVYTIEALLVPSDVSLLASDNTTTGGGGGGGAASGDLTDLDAGGANSIAGGEMNNAFPDQLNASNGNTDTWSFFIPTDTAMNTASVDAAAFAEGDHLVQSAVTAATLTDGSTLTLFGGAAVAVTNDGNGAITVGGFAVTELGVNGNGGVIYSIDGVLPAGS